MLGRDKNRKLKETGVRKDWRRKFSNFWYERYNEKQQIFQRTYMLLISWDHLNEKLSVVSKLCSSFPFSFLPPLFHTDPCTYHFCFSHTSFAEAVTFVCTASPSSLYLPNSTHPVALMLKFSSSGNSSLMSFRKWSLPITGSHRTTKYSIALW